MAMLPPVPQAGNLFGEHCPGAPSPARQSACKKHRNRRAACPLLHQAGDGPSESLEAGTHCFLSFHTTLCGLRKARTLVTASVPKPGLEWENSGGWSLLRRQIRQPLAGGGEFDAEFLDQRLDIAGVVREQETGCVAR